MENEIFEGEILDPKTSSPEPAVTVASLIALVGTVLVLVRAFFPDLLTDIQEDAITGFFMIALPLVVGFIVRSRVTANANVVERSTKSGFVIAGEANEMVEPGQRIRALSAGEENPEPRRAKVGDPNSRSLEGRTI